jgi:hypothetical protein
MFQALCSHDYAVLRGDDRTNDSNSGDIDCAVTPYSLKTILSALKEFGLTHNLLCKILETHDHGCRVVLTGIQPWFFLKLDLHTYESWRGLELLSSQDIIARADFIDGGIRRASKEDQLLMAIIRSVMWGVATETKHLNMQEAINDLDRLVILELLASIFGMNRSKTLITTAMSDDRSGFERLSVRFKTEFILKRLIGAPCVTLVSLFRHYICVMRSLITPRGYRNQYDIEDLGMCSIGDLSVLLDELAPGYPIKICHEKPKFRFPFFGIFRSYEAVIYWLPLLSDSNGGPSGEGALSFSINHGVKTKPDMVTLRVYIKLLILNSVYGS